MNDVITENVIRFMHGKAKLREDVLHSSIATGLYEREEIVRDINLFIIETVSVYLHSVMANLV